MVLTETKIDSVEQYYS